MFASSIDTEDILKLPRADFPGKTVIISKEGKSLGAALSYLSRQKVLGFDTESRPVFSPDQPHYGVSLLQLSSKDRSFLFRIKSLGLVPGLCRILSSPDIIKVGAAVGDDINGLRRYANFTPDGFVDLQKMVPSYGISDKSVKKMAAIILGLRVSKTQQLSNWEATSLSDAQKRYAATDAWICLKMYNKLLESEVVGQI